MTKTCFKFARLVAQVIIALEILEAVLTLRQNGVAEPLVILPLLAVLCLLVSSIAGVKDPLALAVLLIKNYKDLIT